MAQLPPQPADSETVQAIYRAYEAADARKPRRGYLGASVIGAACDRALWFGFRWARARKFDGRMLRLFESGNQAERRFVDDLKAIGCEVHDLDANGHQFEVTALGGHFGGHMDGAALGIPDAPKTWHLLEFKTHNSKSFAALKRDGVQKSKPEHYCQMQVYMHLGELRRGLYLAVNKDTDELYAERVHYVQGEGEQLMARAEMIVRAASPPAKISDNPEHPACLFCDYADLCHSDQVPDVTCRSCLHSTPVIEEGGHGKWTCGKHGKRLTVFEQGRACDDHLFIPLTIGYADAIDGGGDPAGDWVEYRHRDGQTFRNCKAQPHYSSAELRELPAPLVGAGTVDQIKEIFDARVVGVEPLVQAEPGEMG